MADFEYKKCSGKSHYSCYSCYGHYGSYVTAEL